MYGAQRTGMPGWGKGLIACGGGCLVIVVLLGILGAVGWHSLSSSSPLSNFPHYPGSKQTLVNYQRGSGSLDGHDHLILTTPDSADQVLTWYRGHLAGGSYELDPGGTSTDTQVAFHRVGHNTERGIVTVVGVNGETTVDVIYDY